MRRLRASLPAIVLVAIVASMAYLYHERKGIDLRPGDRLGGITLATTTGNPYQLRSDGRPELLNLFASWCGPCNQEMPGLVAAARKLRRHGIDVIAIDQREAPNRALAFARRYGAGFPVYIDTTGATQRAFGVRFIPTTIAVNRHGTIVAVHSGPLTRSGFAVMARRAVQTLHRKVADESAR